MTHIIHKNGEKEYLLVEVPEQVITEGCTIHNEFLYFGGLSVRRTLPTGNYTIIAKANQLTEEQARDMVQREPIGYKSYTVEKGIVGTTFIYKNALSSFASLLRTHNLKAETTLILKKQ